VDLSIYTFFISAVNACYWPDARFGCHSPGKETGQCKPWTTITGLEKYLCPFLEHLSSLFVHFLP